MARDDTEEEKKYSEDPEVQIVTSDQLINFKLDKILEALENLKKVEDPK